MRFVNRHAKVITGGGYCLSAALPHFSVLSDIIDQLNAAGGDVAVLFCRIRWLQKPRTHTSCLKAWNCSDTPYKIWVGNLPTLSSAVTQREAISRSVFFRICPTLTRLSRHLSSRNLYGQLY